MSTNEVFRTNEIKSQLNRQDHWGLSRHIPISFFYRKTDNQPKHNSTKTWVEVGAFLETHFHTTFTKKEDAPLFAATIYNGKRAKDNATICGMFAIDVDERANIAEVNTILREDTLEAISYTSSHNQAGERFRVVIPLSENTDALTCERTVLAFRDYLANRLKKEVGVLAGQFNIDTTKQHPFSIFYVPGQYECAQDNEFHYIEGEVLSSDQWLDMFPQPIIVVKERPPLKEFKLSIDADWDPRATKSWDQYHCLTSERYKGLFGLMAGLAMSAINHLYEITDSELADLADEAQRGNPPSNPTNHRNHAALLKEAARAIDEARGRITDPVGRSQLNRIAYGQGEPWKCGTKGVESVKAMLEDLIDNPPDREDIEDPTWDTDEDKPAPEQPAQPKRRFYRASEYKLLTPPAWLVDKLIPENAVCGLYGDSGSLKSFDALDLEMSIATGLPAFGILPVKGPQPVCYWAGEGFYNIIGKRQLAWKIHRGLPLDSMDNMFFADHAPMMNDDASIDADIEALKELLDGQRLGLFVIDTLSRSLNGADEDKSATAAIFFAKVKKIMDAVGGSCLVVGHFGHEAKRERGSSNFRASFDTVLYHEGHDKDEASGIHTLQLLVSKQKDYDDGRRLWLQSKSILLPETIDDANPTSLVLEPVSEEVGRSALLSPAKKAKAEKRDSFCDEVGAALDILLPGGGLVSAYKLAKYLADKNKPFNCEQDQFQKLMESYRSKLRRGKETGNLKQFIFGDEWGRPVPSMQEQAQETAEMIRDIIDRSEG